MNYLLKMPSDLDYLDDYLAVRKFMGFPLQRNPFNIPAPLEDGVGAFTGMEEFICVGHQHYTSLKIAVINSNALLTLLTAQTRSPTRATSSRTTSTQTAILSGASPTRNYANNTSLSTRNPLTQQRARTPRVVIL